MAFNTKLTVELGEQLICDLSHIKYGQSVLQRWNAGGVQYKRSSVLNVNWSWGWSPVCNQWLTWTLKFHTYMVQCGWRCVFLKFFALYCNSLLVGALGSMRSLIPIEDSSSGGVCPFLKLHVRQAVTVLVQASFPPLDLGITWSKDRSLIGKTSVQY